MSYYIGDHVKIKVGGLDMRGIVTIVSISPKKTEYGVRISEGSAKDYFAYYDASELEKDYYYNPKEISTCQCGSDTLKHPGHAHYCPKYKSI